MHIFVLYVGKVSSKPVNPIMNGPGLHRTGRLCEIRGAATDFREPQLDGLYGRAISVAPAEQHDTAAIKDIR